MEKEFEILPPNVLLEFIDGLLKRYEGEDYNIYITREWLLEIKQALTELKAIKEAKPSEAMECLERIENNILYLLSDCDVDVETDTNFLSLKEHKSCEKIRNYILKAQEQEKVLEIIKEKDVDLRTLKTCFKVERGLQAYNKHQRKENELTQEEFDELKRLSEE